MTINPRFDHDTVCAHCGERDPWGFECCQDCADVLAAEREVEERRTGGRPTRKRSLSRPYERPGPGATDAPNPKPGGNLK